MAPAALVVVVTVAAGAVEQRGIHAYGGHVGGLAFFFSLSLS